MLYILGLAIFGVHARIVPVVKDRTETPEKYWQMWETFKKDMGKTYLTSTQHQDRFEIFMDNVDKINRHNAGDHTWEMGITQFADLTAQEFKDQVVGHNTFKTRANTDNEVWKDTSDLPASVDWTTQNKVTAVKDQGQCGSCWAFSTTGSVESRYAIKKGTLQELSEQELVSCSKLDGNNGCNGGLMDYGFKYVKDNNGLCSESDFPYDGKTELLKCRSGRAKCTKHYDAISGWKDVPTNSMEQLMAAVAEGPVSIAIEADQESFQLYTKGVLSGRCGAKLDHGVLAVGYGELEGQKFWKVKNSWGAKWGLNGYIMLCRDCQKNSGAGECGILGQPSYPTVDN